MPRFVLLAHDVRPLAEPAPPTGAELHWDFLLEVAGGERLLAWRLCDDPARFALEASADMPAEENFRHRRVYLEYEGEISRGRGRVRRVDAGGCTIDTHGPDRLVLSIAGAMLRGRFELKREAGTRWWLRKLGAAPDEREGHDGDRV